jgi:hypothetical protein
MQVFPTSDSPYNEIDINFVGLFCSDIKIINIIFLNIFSFGFQNIFLILAI